MEPIESTLSGEIGGTSPSDEAYVEYMYLAGLAVDELNALCDESGLGISFRFNVSNGENSVADILDLVMDESLRVAEKVKRRLYLFICVEYNFLLFERALLSAIDRRDITFSW